MTFIAPLAILLVSLGLASARQCQNLTIPLSISALNANFSISAPQDNIEVTDFILNLSQQGSNYTETVLSNYTDISDNYTIAATYCTPDAGAGSVLQILTHGIGFDRRYWDISFNNFNYSYVQTAVDQYNYSTLSHDRLGIGESSHGDPVNEIQAALEIAALKELTRLARNQQIQGIGDQFQSVVHVGHSFGSVQTYALARDEPNLSDGLILTGFSQNGTFLPFFQLGGNFVAVSSNQVLASQYVAGYLAAGNPSAVQANFFSPGQFDPDILSLAAQTGQPVTVGELLTIGGATYGNSTFQGPVLVVTGERDVPFCGGDCRATGDDSNNATIIDAVEEYFPNATVFEAFLVPSAGHGLNLEYSHNTTYQYIAQFLQTNGLKA
ncbi:hypothetical protein PV10_08085 [Exophiala mesophila]|uniref:AB hydrolase-1 domain-containing protein n=1 Tax=Exophiala mesophila TaxID=212818 RepID=A0A0D1Z3B7_EXOME|nr:uncharacterized protein PV10_08085 [Exophiala mesophila]KIV88399.1 hypothetical protein PV10_08085 [Exophiala mesophila]